MWQKWQIFIIKYQKSILDKERLWWITNQTYLKHETFYLGMNLDWELKFSKINLPKYAEVHQLFMKLSFYAKFLFTLYYYLSIKSINQSILNLGTVQKMVVQIWWNVQLVVRPFLTGMYKMSSHFFRLNFFIRSWFNFKIRDSWKY